MTPFNSHEVGVMFSWVVKGSEARTFKASSWRYKNETMRRFKAMEKDRIALQ